nr:hypothetical protein [Tanacetum cinerariifolium]
MIRATQPTTIQSVILKARALTNKAGSCGTLSKSSEKRKEVAESSKQGGSWFDNKRAKLGKGFMMAIPTKNGYAGSHQKCAKCHGHHLEGVPCLLCFNCQKPCHFSRDCQSSVKSVAPVNVVRIGNNQRVGYECCSPDHFRNTCPNLNRAPCQVGNCLTTEGTFSLNDHFATILFDLGVDFTFISNEFIPLLNLKPSTLRLSYVIEVANGKKVETDRIIRGCILELGDSLFTIDLIPFGHGSFDTIVGIDCVGKA